MRKILILLVVISLLLVGCGSEEAPDVEVPETETTAREDLERREPTQEELNEMLKRESIEAEFIKVNAGEVESGTRLTATGEISIIMEEGLLGQFTLTTTEGDGYGMYNIMNMATDNGDEIKEGDFVQIWGIYEGKDDSGMPLIVATIIEKVDIDITSNEAAEEEGEEEKEDVEVEKDEEQPDRKNEIEKAVRDRLSDGDYRGARLDKIRVNDDLGTGEGYILLIDSTFTVKNRVNTANDMMRMFSDDLAATLANNGHKDINELAVFWTDEYNDRNLKYAYEYNDGNFYVTDIAGE